MKKFIEYADYVDRDFENEEWVIVAKVDQIDQEESQFTLSRIMKNNIKFIQQILSRWQCEMTPEFGLPKFVIKNKKIYYDVNDTFQFGKIRIQVFTSIRHFDNSSQLDLIQEFILYHNLLFNPEKNHYVEQKNSEVVIEMNSDSIKIKTKYLRDYLAAKNMVLIRYHSHIRHIDKPIMNIINKSKNNIKRKDNTRHYSIMITKRFESENSTYSILNGKDIIKPYNKPLHEDYLYFNGDKDESVSFIIGHTNQGELIKKKCLQSKPSEFLSIVSFKKNVLKRYYDDNSKYSVNGKLISCGRSWNIKYWVKDEQVRVFLGDLSHIPHDEQYYWCSHNVESQSLSNISKIDELLYNEFGDVEPTQYLLKTRIKINAIFKELYGFDLFTELNEKNKHVQKSLHSLLTDDQKEFEEQIILLSKIFIESINKKKLGKIINWNPIGKEKQKSILYLEHYLDQYLQCDQSDAEAISKIFKTIQILRSEYAAHLVSSNIDKTLKKHGFENLSNIEIFKMVILELNQSLNKIFEQ